MCRVPERVVVDAIERNGRVSQWCASDFPRADTRFSCNSSRLDLVSWGVERENALMVNEKQWSKANIMG